MRYKSSLATARNHRS